MRLLLALHFALHCIASSAMRILQIVPGFTNSHILFNYRLAETLTNLGHDVYMWTQMEMSMVITNIVKPPNRVTELRVPIFFSDSMKTEGLKASNERVFQTMMFNEGKAYDLWWTGQEFKDMRIEACEQMLNISEEVVGSFRERSFDLAIAHFHDLCPLAMARKVGVQKVSHSNDLILLSSAKLISKMISIGDPDLWALSQQVPVLLINGEAYLDFPRPLPIGITFMGEIDAKASGLSALSGEIKRIADEADAGIIVFSLGTVSNTTNMPTRMLKSFLEAFTSFKRYTILWRLEKDVPEAKPFKHIHIMNWLPQKDLMRHPKMRLLIAHGGYNSLLETAQAGVPAILMPLFADQFINAKRAQRFGFAELLNKLTISSDIVRHTIDMVLHNSSYALNARRIASILADKPSDDRYASLSHRLRLAVSPRDYFMLKAAHKLSFVQYHFLDLLFVLIVVIVIVCRED
ncbi:Putative UDP-glucuronosyltransferase ugt-60 [Toxocara canis]|uniref:UDP-glucuronosyltransferase n=1 Tax=Toxocara canis TaxID=6265 RepID=A0A0B2VDH2_TOXCA|nr:Putative UDP-glucuronosyltransferase ugt-60 [Toxocara canis]